MKHGFLNILFFVVIYPAYAQLGDFRLRSISTTIPDSLNAIVNPKIKATSLQAFFFGKNYRKEWITQVKVPILDLENTLGGLELDKIGGGKQTHSLHMKVKDGSKVFLRSVKKFPDKALPPGLRSKGPKKIVHQTISGSYPFGVLSVGTLAKAAGVPYFENTLVYLPQDSALGEYTKEYGDALYFMELRWIEENGKKIKDYGTEELVPILYTSNKNKIDQRAVLRARILDNFIMDFDRHEGQFSWIGRDSNGLTNFYPVPKDRDQVFFNIGGMIPKMLKRMQSFHSFEGLRPEIKHVATFNFAARNFDRAFLTEPDRKIWEAEIDAFLGAMTDSVIDAAFAKQPAEIQEFNAQKIAAILKEKRRYFKADMLEYYKSLSRIVAITGSNDPEQFIMTSYQNGTVQVQINTIEIKGKPGREFYHRLFYPGETEELQLYGLEGDDQFILIGDASDIRVRLVGGPGKDNFNNNSNIKKVTAYDALFEDNNISGEHGIKRRFSNHPMINAYRRLGFAYDKSSPGLYATITDANTLYAGISYSSMKHKFRKKPYAYKQSIVVASAINASSFKAMYSGEFIDAIGKLDLLIQSGIRMPTGRTRFYGFGNETIPEGGNSGSDFYFAHYTTGYFFVKGRHEITPWLQLSYGPLLEYLNIIQNKNSGKYFSEITPLNEWKAYKENWYAGGVVSVHINRRNNNIFPTHGMQSRLSVRFLNGISHNTNSYTETGGNLSFYTDVLWKNRLVLAMSFGATKNIGDFIFPQAQYLGLQQQLRGFRPQRFAGRSSAHNNTELRLNFGERDFYFFKGSFGLLGFHDIGRVWSDGEESNSWHRGYGGGVWVAPLNKIVLTGLLTYSKEEKHLAYFSAGFSF